MLGFISGQLNELNMLMEGMNNTSTGLRRTGVPCDKSMVRAGSTSKSEAAVKTSRFDVGSFVGGIVLTLGVLVILYIGCKTYHSRRGIQYRTM
uniref:Uncharacterized protein n=1 Tax=Catharus ustulatus TaxID=91951 RepID=A0A8C3XZR4_CATUS